MANTSVHTPPAAPAPRVEINHEQALTRIREALRDLRFGEVTIVLQDGYVVQVERTEKLRLAR
jgi:hypothetical protein